MTVIRTRFAPSPTGDLHIGGVRTALFSWLFARHHAGQFILRIEDTDQERSTPESLQTILQGLEWLGLDYDEGPYFQSKRMAIYHTVLETLLKNGDAYFCSCSTERLDALRKVQLANQQKPRYDGHCRTASSLCEAREGKVIRFKNPREGIVLVEDQVLGPVQFNNAELDDFVLARSDGTPTYNFTVVVDDYDSNITHVIRGNDHLNNTPRQINVLKALKAPIPVYMHLPMIHSHQGKKLSKREGATSIIEYQKEGFLPETVMNYLVRLGWSHGDQECFSKEELIRYFDGTHLSKSPGMLNPDKLLWLNHHYLKQVEISVLVKAVTPFTKDWVWDKHPKAPLSDIIEAQRSRVKTIKEMAEKSRFFYEKPVYVHQNFSESFLIALSQLYSKFSALSQWEKPAIYEVLQDIIKKNGLKPGELFQPLRQLLVGATISPPVDITIQLLGKARVLDRLHSITHQGP